MTYTNIKHVFFDLDHTLWDFDKNSALTYAHVFKLNDVKVNLKTFLEVYEPLNLQLWKLYREDRITKDYLRYYRLRKTFDTLDFIIDDSTINVLSEGYINRLSSYTNLFEGAVEVLDYLAAKYELHIITNGFREVQAKKLKNSKIKDYFKTVTDSESTGVKKPHPEIFEYALKNVDAKPNESIMIGDSVEADIEGAARLGIKTILCDYKMVINDYEKTKISRLNDLKGIL